MKSKPLGLNVRRSVFFVCEEETDIVQQIFYGQKKRAENYINKHAEKHLYWYGVDTNYIHNSRMNDFESIKIGDMLPNVYNWSFEKK